MDDISHVMKDVSEYISEALSKPLPDEVAEKAKHHLLDSIAAMVSGSTLKPGRYAVQYIREQGGAPEAQVINSDILTSAVNAAWANGMLAHADETDDSHAPSTSHPGCVVTPAALAAAERENASGAELLRAFVLGYDICCRINRAVGSHNLSNAHRATYSVGGTFGAASTAAALMKLSADEVRHVFSYAGQQVSGLGSWRRDTEHIEKAFVFGGMPARNGVAAATMAAAGFTAVDDVLSGPDNFFVAFSPEPDPEQLTHALGEHFEVMVTNIKRWPVGSPIQALISSLTALMDEHDVTPENAASITLRLPERVTGLVGDTPMPDINARYLAAATLIDGTLTFEATQDYERLHDPELLKLKERIELVGDSRLNDTDPPRQGIVEVETTEGEKLQHHTKAVRGTADNPMPKEEVEDKARGLLKLVLTPDEEDAMVEGIWNIEEVESVRQFRQHLKS